MSEETTRPSDLLKVETDYAGAQVTLILSGEFDLTGTEVFGRRVGEAIITHPDSIVVDVCDLALVDSAGLLALVRAREAANAAGATLRVTNPRSMLRLIIEHTGCKGLLLGE